MGRRHLKALVELKRGGYPVDLVATCDALAGRAAESATLYGKETGFQTTAYSSVEEMLENERDLAAVDVVTHPRAHRSSALPCLEAKKHVLVEKPFGITVRDCRAMIDAAKKNNVSIAIEENYRRMPGSRAIKKIIEERVIGDPLMVVTTYINATKGEGYSGKFLPGPKPWGYDKQQVGSLIMLEICIHESNLLRYWFGEADEVSAFTKIFEKSRKYKEGNRESTSEDTAFGLVRFKNEVLANESLSYAGHGQSEVRRHITCSNGSLTSSEWRSWSGGVLCTDEGKTISSEDYVRSYLSSLNPAERECLYPPGTTNMNDFSVDATDPARFGLMVSIWDFVDSIMQARSPEVEGENGLKDVALSCAFLESSLERRPVSLSDIESGRVDGFQRPLDESLGLV